MKSPNKSLYEISKLASREFLSSSILSVISDAISSPLAEHPSDKDRSSTIPLLARSIASENSEVNGDTTMVLVPESLIDGRTI